MYLLLTGSVNPSEILATKSIFHEQLHSLTQKFNNLGDDNCDYEEANVKFAAATNLKYTSLLKNIDELVSRNIDNLQKYLDKIFDIISILIK